MRKLKLKIGVNLDSRIVRRRDDHTRNDIILVKDQPDIYITVPDLIFLRKRGTCK